MDRKRGQGPGEKPKPRKYPRKSRARETGAKRVHDKSKELSDKI